MSGISDSAKFNATSSYYYPSDANTAAGVISLNGLAGVLSVSSPDNSLSVVAAGPLINVSTTGQAQAPSTVAATGAITSASTITSTGNMLAPRFANTGASGAANGSGFYGSRVYNVNLTAGVNNQDIGLNGFLNDTVPHLIEVMIFATPAVVGNGALAFSNARILSYSNRSTGQVPILTNTNTGNFGAGGIQTSAGGTLGSYTINVNVPGGAYTGAYTVCVTCIY
jgi:hypothetical protein